MGGDVKIRDREVFCAKGLELKGFWVPQVGYLEEVASGKTQDVLCFCQDATLPVVQDRGLLFGELLIELFRMLPEESGIAVCVGFR